MVLPDLGSFQSLLPVARPTKLATEFGDLSENSSQVMRPAVVSKTAVGLVTCGIGVADAFAVLLVAVVDFFAAGFFAGAVCASRVDEMRTIARKTFFIRITP